MDQQALEEQFAVSLRRVIEGRQLIKELERRIEAEQGTRRDSSATRRQLESHRKIQQTLEEDHKRVRDEMLKDEK